MENKTNSSFLFRGFILVLILLLTIACSIQKGLSNSAGTNPTDDSTASAESGSPTSSVPAQSEEQTNPAETGAEASEFPFTLSDNLLTAYEVAGYSDLAQPVAYQMVEDGQGVLHVMWTSLDQLFYRQRNGNGEWSDAAKFPDIDEWNQAKNAKLLVTPEGQACLLWPNHPAGEKIEFQVECVSGDQWSPSQDLIQLEPISDPYANIESYQYQFDPQGHLKFLILLSTSSQTLPSGFYLGEQRLFPDEDTSMDLTYHFRIDSQGSYHLVFIHNQSIIYRTSSDQGKTWQEPAVHWGATLNDGYAGLPTDQNTYFHFLMFGESSLGFISWISSQKIENGLPLFDGDKMFEEAMKDQRYLDLTSFSLKALTLDKEGKLHFAASDGGIYHVVLENDGTWLIQKIQEDGFDPIEMLISQNGDTFFLWSTLDGLYFTSLTE